MKKLLLSLLILLGSVSTFATHIIGGEIIYTHLGGSSYLITLKVYRDCDPASVDFAANYTINVRQANGAVPPTGASFSLPMQERDTLDPPIDTCAFDPGVCVEEAIYSKVVSLPPGVGGYHLWFTICCRNGSIDNLTSPLTTQETFYAWIPENNIWLTNSSPSFSNFPPVFVCQGVDLDLDFSATDPDGDFITYSFYQPYHTGVFFDADAPPDNWACPTVTYSSAGFSATDPLDFAPGFVPGLTISASGIINGIPPNLGQYVVGVMINEFRDGVFIGRKTRDFQFNVLACPPPQNAGIGSVDGCSGSLINFDNESGAGANGFWWDFGTGNPADTSILENPSFDYTPYGLGPFTVTLIAQKGTLCADTTIITVTISDVIADFTGPDTLCVNESGTWIDASVPEVNGTVDYWEWDFGDGATASVANPSHAYSASGDYVITFIVGTDVGCFDTITKTVHVNDPPAAGIGTLTGCIGLTVDFTNTSDPSASDVWWYFDTGNPADTSIIADPTFTYTVYGSYDVMLVTQHNQVCSDTTIYTVLISNVIADFIQPDTTCTNVLIDFVDASTNVNGVINDWQWDFGDFSFSTAQNPSHGYTAAGDYTVTLIIGSSIGCSDTVTKIVTIEDPPVATIGVIDFCSGLTVDFTNDSDPDAYGFWWDFGTGDPADSSIVFEPTFTYGSYGTYTVTLIAQKGTDCESQTDITFALSDITADFVAPDTACQDLSVSFFDASATVAPTTITLWEWDFGDFTTSGLTDPTHTYTPGGSYDVELVVTNSVGCTDTIVKTIFIETQPDADAGVDTAVCVSAPSYDLSGVILNAGGGIWTGGGGVFIPSVTDLNATYFPSLAELISGGTFLVLTSTGNGSCPADDDTLNILYLDNPNVDAGPDIDVCEDSLYIPLNATIEFPADVTWTTTGDGSFDDNTLLNPVYTFGPTDAPSGSVTFYINTSNTSGCPEDADTVVLTFNPPPVMNTLNDTTICAGFDLVLNSGSSTGDGLWGTLGDGTFSPNPSASTTYTHGNGDFTAGTVTLFFETTNNGGCSAVYDTLLVTILPSPQPGFDFTEECFGIASVFTNTSTAVDPITGYEWTFEPGATSGATDTSYTFPAPGVYNVELVVLTANGCTDTLYQNVQVFELPVPGFDVPEPCLNGGTAFIDTSTVGDSVIDTWAWNFGDGSAVDTNQNPTHYFGAAGPYTITLTVTSANGCSEDTTVTLNVLPGPLAAFSMAPQVAQPYQDVQFTDESVPSAGTTIIIWEWQFDDGDTAWIQDPIHSYEDEGEYDVMLIVTDNNGCEDTAVHELPVYHGPKVPNAFSPNGDGGNDFLMILGGNYETIDFKVYNNWGQLIYETQDPNASGWNGKFHEKEQPIGVYCYVAKVTTYDGVEHLLNGDVSLIR